MDSRGMIGGLGRSCVLSWKLLDWSFLVEFPCIGRAEVTYVFERIGVGFGIILKEVARHCLILDFLTVVLHLALVRVRSLSE